MSSSDVDSYEDDFDEHLASEFHPARAADILELRLSRALNDAIRPSAALRSARNAVADPPVEDTPEQQTDNYINKPARDAPPSSRGLRQSQDLFAALDLAGTDSSLKEQYGLYWDAVEAQCQAAEVAKARTTAAESKHLQRLKAKMAGAPSASSMSVATRQEQGWNDGFAFDREPHHTHAEHAIIHSRSPRATRAPFERPSVVKASQALANYMATTGQGHGGFTSSLVPGSGSTTVGSKKVPSSSPNNAKPLPPAPGTVDPARVRKVVQTHMPQIVLARLAASRRRIGHTANAQPAIAKRKTLSRPSSVKHRGSHPPSLHTGDEEDLFSEELSPASRLTSAKSKNASTRSVPAGAKGAPASSPSLGHTSTLKPRAASAGVKPTNASMLLAAERAAHAHATASGLAPTDSKTIPLTQWNRIKRELEELRRKVEILERENDMLRQQHADVATSAASPQPAHASSSASPPAASASVAPKSRVSSAAASGRPTATKSALGATGGKPSVASRVHTAAAPAAAIASPPHSSSSSSAKTLSLGLKLNLAGLSDPGSPPPPAQQPSQHKSLESAMMSPRARCAVNQCGQPRMPAKPYCIAHIAGGMATPNNAASTAAAATPPVAAPLIATPHTQASTTSAVGTPSQHESASSSLPAATIPGQGYGMHGLNLHLGSTVKKYEYDYPSDDDYGGLCDDDDDSFLGSDANLSGDDDTGGSSNRQPASTDDPSTAYTDRTEQRTSRNDGLTARNDGLTARNDGLTQRNDGNTARNTSARQYAANDLSSRSTGQTVLTSSAVRPVGSVPPPRVSPPHANRVIDLESLRASPYSGIDGALNGSFEITQSGTFKRGGFALNRRGMSTDAGADDDTGVQQWDGLNTRRVGTPTSSTAVPSAAVSSARRSPPAAGSPTAPPAVRSLDQSDLYTLGVLGRGSGGVVYKAFHAPSMEILAIKAIGIHEQDKRKQLTQELRTLTMHPSPYTIGFRGAYFDDHHIYIALEYMDQGSLDDLASQEGTVLSEIEIAFIFEQVLRGLVHLEKEKIIHRDIKPHNILYNSHGQFKVTDFGIISDWKDRSDAQAIAEAKTFVGTLLYMSPERIGGQPYSYACDIWSMALSMISCRIGKFAIEHNSHWELVNAIQSGPAILNAFPPDILSDSLRDLLQHCLRVNPIERPTAEECLRHPFFSRLRLNGPNHPIPIPPGFPPIREQPSPTHAALATSIGESEKELRRIRRDQDQERKNQQHQIEAVCALIVARGLTTRGAKGNISTSVTSPPLPLPMDTRLCDRMTDRLALLLKWPPTAIRPALLSAHNKHVGYQQK